MESSNNLYDILQINKNASQVEIKKAFHKLALQYHPDKNKDDPDAENKFKEINKAYSILSNETSRKEYDLYGNVNEDDIPNFEMNLNDLLSQLFGGSGIPQNMFFNESSMFQGNSGGTPSPIFMFEFMGKPSTGGHFMDESFSRDFIEGSDFGHGFVNIKEQLENIDWFNIFEPVLDNANQYFQKEHKKEKEKKKNIKKKDIKQSNNSEHHQINNKNQNLNDIKKTYDDWNYIKEYDLYITIEDRYIGKNKKIYIPIKKIYNSKREFKEEKKELVINCSKHKIECKNQGDSDNFRKISQDLVFYLYDKKHLIYKRKEEESNDLIGLWYIPIHEFMEGGIIKNIAPNGKEIWEINLESFEKRGNGMYALIPNHGFLKEEQDKNISKERGDLYIQFYPISKLEDQNEYKDLEVIKKKITNWFLHIE